MGLGQAFKAFFKALKQPEEAQKFLEGKPQGKIEDKSDPSHLRLLALLQQAGRLIDFLKEDISAFSDAQVGAAVRKIHQDCGKSLEDLVTIRPIMEESEGQKVDVPEGYDTALIKVVGNVKGKPPYAGKLVHKGWKAHKRSLPKHVNDKGQEVLHPAEVEVS